MIAGIDEAGRGPIIGPMVMAGVLIEEEIEQELKALGVKDSKLLELQERENLFPLIQELAKAHVVECIWPEEIDDAVKGKDGLNLNKLEAKKTAEILNKLKPQIAYVDSPSPNLKAYKELLQGQLTFSPKKLITEHKADTRYVVVGAASILAKVIRDREIEKIKKEIGIDFGSGYLSDPKTSEFLQKHHESYPHLFRKSWFPYQDLINSKFQRSLADFTSTLQEKHAKKTTTLTIDDLKKLEPHGFAFQTPKSSHEAAIMKGPCTVILYKSGTLLIQGTKELEESVKKLLYGSER